MQISRNSVHQGNHANYETWETVNGIIAKVEVSDSIEGPASWSPRGLSYISLFFAAHGFRLHLKTDSRPKVIQFSLLVLIEQNPTSRGTESLTPLSLLNHHNQNPFVPSATTLQLYNPCESPKHLSESPPQPP
jgi:hypothetical protein